MCQVIYHLNWHIYQSLTCLIYLPNFYVKNVSRKYLLFDYEVKNEQL